MTLNHEEALRYSRQLILRGWGTNEQLRLKSLGVVLSATLPAAALYLAAAGVGRLNIWSDNGSHDSARKLVHHLQSFNPRIQTGLAEQTPAEKTDYIILNKQDISIIDKTGSTPRVITVEYANGGVSAVLCEGQHLIRETRLDISFSPAIAQLLGGTAAALLVIHDQLAASLNVESDQTPCLC